jgi:Sortase domain
VSCATRSRIWLLVSVLTAVAGVALLVTAATGMARHRPVPGDFGGTERPDPNLPAMTRPDAGWAHSTLSRPAPTSTGVPPTSTGSVTLAEPVTLTIPALHVEATVLPVSTSYGALGVPDDPTRVGWWTGSALPGAPSGSVVIDGHVDSAAAGPGALFRLADLHPGEPIQITTTTGDQHPYIVTGRRVYPKAGGLPPDLFATTGPSRLVLISCGGPFDRTTGSYLDNIAVFAVPT